MSDSYRNGAFALGLVTGIGLTINMVLWLDLRALREKNQAVQAGFDQEKSQLGQFWDGLIGTFVTPGDTLAQWIMAILTIVAVALLFQTLRQTNKTNEAAISAANAASEANAIMRNEQIPWVVLHRTVECDFRDSGSGGQIAWNYNFENIGNGPAYDLKLVYTLIKRAHLQGMKQQLEAFLADVLSKQRMLTMAVLFPQEHTDFVPYTVRGGTRYQADEFSAQSADADGQIMMMACLTYRLSQRSDAFGYDVRMFSIDPSERWLGPWGHKLIEYSSARLIG